MTWFWLAVAWWFGWFALYLLWVDRQPKDYKVPLLATLFVLIFAGFVPIWIIISIIKDAINKLRG
jgi:hypothetical protein